MAGGKKTKAEVARLDKEYGEDAILDARSSGLSVRQICLKFDTTIRLLYSWLGNLTGNRQNEVNGVTRRERWDQATEFAAEARAAMADERLEALINPDTGRIRADVSREEVSLAKALSDQDRWQAGNLSPKAFRPNQPTPSDAVTAGLTVGAMFLEALRRDRDLPAPARQKALPEPIEDADFEEVDDDE